MLTPDQLSKYQAQRPIGAPMEKLCNAPFNNMYFTVTGLVGACWLTVFEQWSDRWSPTRSIRDIWFGEKFQELRQALDACNMDFKCQICKHNIQKGSYPLARAYDTPNPLQEYPSMMEMELSNLCNMECLMCTGTLSSRIRQYREKLPPLDIPYTQAFVDQLDEFIPHLKELRFNGGEPFLHDLVLQIFDKVKVLNPGLRITIATNGSVLNERVRTAMRELNIYINLSLDSLIKEKYELIRLNGKFDTVLANLEELATLTHEYGRSMCIMINPMRMNWDEMPHYVDFCNARGLHLWYNTIQRPLELALWNLPKAKLQRIYDTLAAAKHEPTVGPEHPWFSIQSYNIDTYQHLVQQQILGWLQTPEPELLKAY